MRELGKLTEQQAEIFKNISVCKYACKEIVKEVVHEYELAVKQLDVLWTLIREDFGKDLTKDEADRIQINHDTLAVNLLSEKEFLQDKLKKDENTNFVTKLYKQWRGE